MPPQRRTADQELEGDWTVDFEEVSANVYRARAEDGAGRSVEMTGADPEALETELRRRAYELKRD